MFQAQVYTVPPCTAGSALYQWNIPPQRIIPVENRIKGATGRLTASTTATIFNKNGVTMAQPALTFTKPVDANDLVKSGSCWFLVNGIPLHKRYFDLEFTLYRPIGHEVTMAVVAEVIGQDGTATALSSFAGTLVIPAGSPVLQMARVDWTDGQPGFLPFTTDHIAETQALRLTFSTTDAIDEIVSFLSMRFTFWANI